jgi:hypothetical protein
MKTGLLQFVGAALLAVLAFQLPSADGVERDHHLAAEATRGASQQIALAELRLNGGRAEQLVPAAHRSGVDPAELRQLRDSLDAVGQGLRALAVAFDPQPPMKLGQGLGEAADYLDKQLVPAAEKAAQELEEASALLQTDTLRLAELLRVAPLDLDAIQTVHDALGKFATGTEALHRMLELSRLGEIRGGLQGLEASLGAAAEQVDQLGGYTYPVVRISGWKPYVDYNPFWPRGGEIAQGLTQAQGGVKAADKELEAMGRELPKVRAAVDSSRQILEKSRHTLSVVLKHRDMIEPLIKSLPETAARLADDLPKLTKQFSATLRDTQRLKEMAQGLRETQAHLDKSVAGWPEVRRTLASAADAIQARRQQLDSALAAEASYERQLHARRVSEERSLSALRFSLESVADSQSAHAANAGRLLTTVRWSLLAVAGVLAFLGLLTFLPTSRR